MSSIIQGQQQAEESVNQLNGLGQVSHYILWALNHYVRAESATGS